METDSITGNPDDLNLNNLKEIETTEEPEITETKSSTTLISGRPSISLKKQPELLCNCPLHCDSKIGKEWRKTVYKQFQDIGDHALQNQYIQRHIKIKSIAKRLWEEEIVDKKIQRRVTCKYLIPMTGSVMDSYSYSRTLTYDSVKVALDTSWTKENDYKPDPSKKLLNTPKTTNPSSEMQKDLFNSSKITNSFSETPINLSNSSKITNSFSETPINLSNSSKITNSFSETPIDLSNSSKITNSYSETPEDLTATKMTNSFTDTQKDLFSTPMTDSFSTVLRDSLSNSKKSNSFTDTSNTQTDLDSTMNETLPENISKMMNGHDPPENKRLENTAKDTTDVNSPLSFNDNDSVNNSPDDANNSELENNSINPVKYIEVCQKAFMNMYGITEKRIRWQREKLILKSRILAEKKRRELDEMDRTLSLARSLGAGCQPLFAFLEKSNCLHLSEQLMGAIEDDVALVNNFFHNQLWKPEDIMNKSIHVPSLNVESFEAECD